MDILFRVLDILDVLDAVLDAVFVAPIPVAAFISLIVILYLNSPLYFTPKPNRA